MPRLSYRRALNRALADELARDDAVFLLGEDVRVGASNVTTGLAQAVRAGTGHRHPAVGAGVHQLRHRRGAGRAAAGDRVPDPVAAVPGLRADRQPGAQVPADDRRAVQGPGHLPGARLRLAHRLGRAALRPPVQPLRPRRREHRRAGHPGRRVRAAGHRDPRRRPGGGVRAGRRAGRARRRRLRTWRRCRWAGGRIHRSGDDVTVVAVGHLVHDALAVAEELADQVSVEVFDPRTLYPFDFDGLGRVGGPHRPARGVRRLQPVLRHRPPRSSPRWWSGSAARPAAPGHPPGRGGAAVRPGAGPGRAARPGPARHRHPPDHEGLS